MVACIDEPWSVKFWLQIWTFKSFKSEKFVNSDEKPYLSAVCQVFTHANNTLDTTGQ